MRVQMRDWGRDVKLEPLIKLPSLLSGVWRGLGVHVFEGAITLADMQHMEVIATRWHKSHPNTKVVELVVIYPSDTKMSSEERHKMAAIIRRFETQRVASATVILATGLLGAMQRSVLTGLMMLSPAPHPAKVFGTVASSVSWLTPPIRSVCGDDAKETEILASIDTLCTEFKASRPAASVNA